MEKVLRDIKVRSTQIMQQCVPYIFDCFEKRGGKCIEKRLMCDIIQGYVIKAVSLCARNAQKENVELAHAM